MKFLITVLSIGFLCSCSNPYEQKLKIYEMNIAASRDEAILKALELSHKERIEIEKQYIDKAAKDDMIFSGYISLTGKTPEDVEKMPIYSLSIYNQYESDKTEKFKKRSEEINKAYEDFYQNIEAEDKKVDTIKKATEEINAERKKTYMDIVKMFGVSILSLGLK